MSAVELTESLLAHAAGWQAMKEARGLVERDQVLSSDWAPPVLKGVVQAGPTAYRAGLVIKGPIDIENLCTCRAARKWGTICAHAVAVGLHFLKRTQAAAAVAPVPPSSASPGKRPAATQPSASRLVRAGSSGEGEPLELFVILPPNLEQAIARGRVMLCFEGQWRRGRAPLNALPKAQPFTVTPPDAALLDQIEAITGGEPPAMLQLDAKAFAAVLAVLVGHPRVTIGKSAPVAITRTPWAPQLKAALLPDGEIELRLAAASASPLALLDEGWVYQNRTFQPLGLPKACLAALRGALKLRREEVPVFISQEWPRLAALGVVEADFRPDDFTLEPAAPRFVLHLTGGLARLHALLQCRYGARIMTVGVTPPGETLWLPDPAAPTRYTTRDPGAERAALGRLLRAGFTGPDAQGRYALAGQNGVLNFFARECPRLQREWEVTLEERLERSTAQNLERLEPQCRIMPSGVQWFDFSVRFTASSGEAFSPADIQRLLLSGQSHARLRSGKTAVIDTGAVEELQEVLRDCSPQQQGQAYRMSSAQAGFVEATLRTHGWQAQAPAAWRERARQQSGEAKLDCPPLGGLEGVLRPYQKSGVAWLHFLRANGFGGILADEMGLGKTLQALALLQSLSDRAGPALVVCPTSLVFNWAAEAGKFTPRLRALALHGPERHALFERLPQSDLVITSYALARRDAARYREVEFDTVILDEAQHIKNRQTQNAQAVKAIRARHRLVLTGTPLENSVLDLWSIFDFLMPGYLGAAQDFRERYELPITRERNAEVQARLARRVRPFMLRRTKREVAPDLPAKLEQVAFCELTEDQRAVYQQVMEASRREVLEAVGADGVARSRLVVLTALLRLRQVCCDLRLLKLPLTDRAPAKPDDRAAPRASGKLELFGELLEEVLDGGHRALVFSQFTTMLGLLREQLAAEGVEFCYLDGATADRAAAVERFQRDARIPVFLISLKAGGVGLNLTGADTVIHFDPWWNPAVEDQATDRAHRLGQTRVVTSYKLIARGTVEEKILTLQQRKRDVTAATLGGEESFAAALTREEIQELFAG